MNKIMNMIRCLVSKTVGFLIIYLKKMVRFLLKFKNIVDYIGLLVLNLLIFLYIIPFSTLLAWIFDQIFTHYKGQSYVHMILSFAICIMLNSLFIPVIYYFINKHLPFSITVKQINWLIYQFKVIAYGSIAFMLASPHFIEMLSEYAKLPQPTELINIVYTMSLRFILANLLSFIFYLEYYKSTQLDKVAK